MKNKNFVSSGLLLLIIVLIGVTASYYYFKKDNLSDAQTPIQNVDNKDNEEQTSASNKNKNDNKVPVRSKVKKITTYDEFNEYSSRQENTFFVLGRTGCHYCEMYLPVLDTVSSEYNIEIVYLDFSKFAEEDYKAVMHSELSIPSKCTTSGEETPLSNGFGTPLSLFVSNGQSYDCIRGYKNNDSLVSELKKIGFIS